MTYALPTWPSVASTLSGDKVFRREWANVFSSGFERYIHEPEISVPDDWLGSALLHLKELGSLVPGWDEASALSIAPSLVETVSSFISSKLVLELRSKPDIVPTFEGGLLIEWHTEAIDLIIDMRPSDEPSFYFCDNETGEEVEAYLAECPDAVTSAFAKLSHER